MLLPLHLSNRATAAVAVLYCGVTANKFQIPSSNSPLHNELEQMADGWRHVYREVKICSAGKADCAMMNAIFDSHSQRLSKQKMIEALQKSVLVIMVVVLSLRSALSGT